MALLKKTRSKEHKNLVKMMTESIVSLDDCISVIEKSEKGSFGYSIYLKTTIGLVRDIEETLKEFPEILNETISEDSSNYDGYFVRLISYALPPEQADDAELHLADSYEKWAKRFGAKAASRRVQWHAFWTVLCFHKARLKKWLGALAALVGIKKLGDWVGRFF